MSEIEVKIVRLEPLRVASVTAFGESPEVDSQERLLAWAREQGLDEAGKARFFGFNNPSPTPGSPNYGYEFWMTVPEQAQASAGVTIKHFEGGLYAVTRVRGVENIYAAWQQLLAWIETSPYTATRGQCLEEHILFQNVSMDDLTLDLYQAVRE